MTTENKKDEIDTRSHYKRYTKSHKKYEKSDKGKLSRERYMSSEKGKIARKKYQTKRNLEIKELLRSARESGGHTTGK